MLYMDTQEAIICDVRDLSLTPQHMTHIIIPGDMLHFLKYVCAFLALEFEEVEIVVKYNSSVSST
jgi:hypothetical protein